MTGLAAGLLLAACLVLTPGCGTATATPPVSPVTTGREAVTTGRVPVSSPGSRPAGGVMSRSGDDLKERRARNRLAAQARG